MAGHEASSSVLEFPPKILYRWLNMSHSEKGSKAQIKKKNHEYYNSDKKKHLLNCSEVCWLGGLRKPKESK